MENQYIQLVPADLSLAEQVVDYYERNRDFVEAFEPLRSEEFFSLEYQRAVLKKEISEYKARTAFRFYIISVEQPAKIIGMIGLNNVVWGAFCSAFLRYKLDKDFVNKGYMSIAVEMLTKYAFEELGLHRIEANVMPKNKASLRVLGRPYSHGKDKLRYTLNSHLPDAGKKPFPCPASPSVFPAAQAHRARGIPRAVSTTPFLAHRSGTLLRSSG